MCPLKCSGFIAVLFFLSIPADVDAVTWEWLIDQATKVSVQGTLDAEARRRGQDSALVLGRSALKLAKERNGAEDQSIGYILNRIGDYHFRRGDHTDADSIWVRAFAVNASASPAAAREMRRSLFCLGISNVETGAPQVDPLLMREAMALRDSTLTSHTPDVAELVWDLATVCGWIERVEMFYELMRLQVAIWEETPASDPRYAIRAMVYLAENVSKPSVGNVGRSSADQASAVSLACRALELAEDRLGSNDTLVAIVATRLGDYHDRLGHFSEAVRLWEKACAINHAVLPPEHIEVQGCLQRMGGVYRHTGRFAEAEYLARRALALRAKTQGEGHPETAGQHMRLGRLQHVTGEYDAAEECYRRALSIRERAVERIDSDVAQSLRYLGLLYFDRGWYAASEDYLLQALELRQASLEPNHHLAAKCRRDLASLYRTWGRMDEADRMLDRVLASQREFLGVTHPDVATTLRDIASLHTAMSDHAGARRYLDQALSILEADPEWKGIEQITFQIEVAKLDLAEGHLLSAETALRAVILQQSGLFGTDDHRLVPTLLDLARVLQGLGRSAGADSLFHRIEAVRDKVPELLLPVFASASEEHALSSARNGDLTEALMQSFAAYRIRATNLHDGALVMSERDALICARRLRSSRDQLLSHLLAVSTTENVNAQRIAGVILASKGATYDEVLSRNLATLNEPDVVIRALKDSLRYVSSRLAHLHMINDRVTEESQHEIISMRSEKQRFETMLARRVNRFHVRSGMQLVTAQEVSDALPERSVLVEYLQFDLNQFGEDSAVSHYLALTVDVAGVARIHDLGDAGEINAIIEEYRNHMAGVSRRQSPPDSTDLKQYWRIATRLCDRVWEPVETDVTGADLVFVAPDGALNFVSFAGLPDAAKSYQIESRAFHYLSTGRDLLRLEEPETAGRGLLAVGDPDFDATMELRRRADSKTTLVLRDEGPERYGDFHNLRSTCLDLTRSPLARLAGTRTEVESAAMLWEESSGEPVWTLVSAMASEEQFKSLAPGKRILHLATHGFSMTDACRNERTAERNGKDPTGAGKDPLLRCGLALAGANLIGRADTPEGVEDGILTGEEICRLNLSGVDRVILSACETALGQIESGEGVYGLRRAFQMAGARTVVSALWKIPDGSTQETVRHLYETGNSLPELLRQAALASLEDLRTRGQPDHPYNWGAFISTGDWKTPR